MKLMQKTPEKRYQSAKGLTTDLLMLIHRILHPTAVVATSHGHAEDLEARMRAAIAGLGRLRTLKDDQIYDALRNFDLTLGIKDEPLYQVRPALHYIAREEEREDMGRVVREVLNGEQEACLIAVRGDVGAGMTRLVVEMGGQVRERGQGVFGKAYERVIARHYSALCADLFHSLWLLSKPYRRHYSIKWLPSSDGQPASCTSSKPGHL